MRAVIYSRVSSTQQAEEGFSLEAQYEKLIKYVDEQKWELTKVYTDPGVSAKSLNRPGIQELISDMKTGKFEAIVIHKLDRLTRNIADLCDLVDLVVKYNVKLVSLSEQLETSTPMGLMFIRMLGVLAQMFRENLAEEIVKGQSMRASKGLRVSAARPYGYDLGENLAMSIKEDEADIVREIFDLFLQGSNFGEIAASLKGRPAAKGGIWHAKVIGRILANPTYIGVNHWKRKNDPDEKRIYVENAHDAVIDINTFTAAQEILQARKEHFLSRSSTDFCFASVVKCGLCGRGISGRNRNENGRVSRDYRCNGKVHGCKMSYISEKTITNLFLDYITTFNFQTDEPAKIIFGKDIAKEKKRLERSLLDSSNAKKNYARAMGSGKMEYDLFSELIEEENKKSEMWQNELDAINAVSPATKKTRKDFITQVNNLKSEWPAMSERQRKMTISKIFKYIIIKKTDSTWNIVGSKFNE